MNIEEAKKKLLEPQKIPLIEIIRKFKREGIENFVITRPEIVETLLTAYEKEKEKNNNVLVLIFEYGQTDGEHHKAWVIDQIVRIITENNYDKWVQHYEYDEETDENYFWDVGIAP